MQNYYYGNNYNLSTHALRNNYHSNKNQRCLRLYVANALKHNEKKDLFARSAVRVIDKLGVGGFTLRDVASDLNVTTGSLQYYFASKEELLTHAKNVLFDDLAEKLKVAGAKHDGPRKIIEMALSVLPTDERAAITWRVYIGLLSLTLPDKKMRREQARRGRNWVERFKEALCESQAKAELSANLDAEKAAIQLVMYLEGLSTNAVTDPDFFTAEKQKALLKSFVNEILAN